MGPKVKKPRKPRKPRIPTKPKPKSTVIKNERDKQAVNVNVRIDQSKRIRRDGGGGRVVARQPANIINFPANTPVSEIRYNPAPGPPAPGSPPAPEPAPPPAFTPGPPPAPGPAPPLGMSAPEQVTENILAKTTEPSQIYKSPYSRNPSNILGTVGSVATSFLTDSYPDAVVPSEPSLLGAATSVGSQLLSEAYPEYSGIINLASQFSQSNIAKNASRRVIRGITDAYDNLSFVSKPQTVVSGNTSMKVNVPSVDSSVYSSNVYDWIAGQNSGTDNSTIITSDSLRAETNPDYTAETLTAQMKPPIPILTRTPANKISDEEGAFQAGPVAGRIFPVMNRIPVARAESEYDRFRSENKGKFTRAQMSDAWAAEKEKKKKGM